MGLVGRSVRAVREVQEVREVREVREADKVSVGMDAADKAGPAR
jgi:hypothetical protein